MAFNDQLEDMILDELTTFVQCPGKDVLADKFTIEREPLSTKYRIFVSDDVNGVVLGIARFLLTSECYVGLPYNIFYESVDDVAKDYDRLKISTTRSPGSWWRGFFGGRSEGQKIEWGSEVGVKLMQTLVLSNEEKRFLTQRLIQEADAVNTLATEVVGVMLPTFIAGFLNYTFKKWNHMTYRYRSRPILLPFYLTTTVGALLIADYGQKISRTFVDTESDRITAEIGEAYLQGGESYYKKLMERNRCINQLLEKSKMNRMYDQDGDYLQGRLFRKKVTSLKERLQIMTDTAEKAKEKRFEK